MAPYFTAEKVELREVAGDMNSIVGTGTFTIIPMGAGAILSVDGTTFEFVRNSTQKPYKKIDSRTYYFATKDYMTSYYVTLPKSATAEQTTELERVLSCMAEGKDPSATGANPIAGFAAKLSDAFNAVVAPAPAPAPASAPPAAAAAAAPAFSFAAAAPAPGRPAANVTVSTPSAAQIQASMEKAALYVGSGVTSATATSTAQIQESLQKVALSVDSAVTSVAEPTAAAAKEAVDSLNQASSAAAERSEAAASTGAQGVKATVNQAADFFGALGKVAQHGLSEIAKKAQEDTQLVLDTLSGKKQTPAPQLATQPQ